MRRDSLEFDRTLKAFKKRLEETTGADLSEVQITSIIAKHLNPDEFIKSFNIIIGKRGKPKSII